MGFFELPILEEKLIDIRSMAKRTCKKKMTKIT